MNIQRNLKIERYPNTTNKSLKPWNAADEFLLDYLESEKIRNNQLIIFHDRFGYLSCHLQHFSPLTIINYKSQEKSISKNLKNNSLSSNKKYFLNPLQKIETEIDTAIIKIPKSIDLFELYLFQLNTSLTAESKVICGFMTRHYSKKALEIAQKYFEEVKQSKARKKARLMILKKPKKQVTAELIHKISLSDDKLIKQYYGVFSGSKIDMATQFLLNHIHIKPHHHNILDLGCGNGILALKARQINPSANIHLTDDSFLAIESAKLNLGSSSKNHFYFTDHLVDFNDHSIDLVVSNPPFHFEHENNIDITLNLFKDVYRILKPKGAFQLVSNLHLNYKTHLTKLFSSVLILAKNDKFVIYKCLK